jgi:hypothetical protein
MHKLNSLTIHIITFLLFNIISIIYADEVVNIVEGNSHIGLYPRGCDVTQALQCEYDFLNCRLFTGPADDPPTLCACGSTYFAQCLRIAGVS